MLRVDLHTHSWYSADSLMSPARLIRRARAVGLDRVAITDHGSVAGALVAAAMDPELVIVGEEMRCIGGTHMIGLFLHELIPNGLTIEETARRIREQGGLVYAPHPFAYLRSINGRAERALAMADVMEVFNARAFWPRWNRDAAGAAIALRMPVAAGTDAHLPNELGNAYTEMPAFTDAPSFRAALSRSRPAKMCVTPLLAHAASLTSHFARVAIGRGHGKPLKRDAVPAQMGQ